MRIESANPRLAGVASGSYTDNLGLIRLTIDPATRQVTSADSTPARRGLADSKDSTELTWSNS